MRIGVTPPSSRDELLRRLDATWPELLSVIVLARFWEALAELPADWE